MVMSVALLAGATGFGLALVTLEAGRNLATASWVAGATRQAAATLRAPRGLAVAALAALAPAGQGVSLGAVDPAQRHQPIDTGRRLDVKGDVRGGSSNPHSSPRDKAGRT